MKKSRSNLNEPSNCIKEYKKEVCDECVFNEYTLVPHPGGSGVHSVERHHCEWGYWEEDF